MRAASGTGALSLNAGGIEPGAVYTVDPSKVHLPAALANGPHRDNRWLLVVSCKDDCRHEYSATVLVVILSAKVQNYWARHDVLVEKGDGGTDQQCIAQADTVFPLLKSDLLGTGTLRGGMFKDTLRQVRARIGAVVGLDHAAPAQGG